MTGDWWQAGVRDTGRLAALERSGLVATQPEPEDGFDRLTELAAAITGVTRACITLVDSDRYFYKSTVGVPEGASPTGPVEASFCRYVVGSGRPFVVSDAPNDPDVWDNPAIKINEIVAWAGFPIEDSSGWVLGTFCLIDNQPRDWTDTDLHVLATLARVASSEIALRHAQVALSEARSAAQEICAHVETALATVATDVDITKTELAHTAELARTLWNGLGPVLPVE